MKRNRISLHGSLILGTAIAALGLGCGGSPGTTADDGIITSNAEHLAMIAKLTGKDVDTSAPKGADGKALPADYNPLGGPTAVLNKESEIFLAGMAGTDSVHGFAANYAANAIFDGKTATPFSSVWTSTAEDASAKTLPWTTLHKKATGADVDGDGLEEICVLYMSASYTPTGSTAAYRDLVLDIYDGDPSASSRLKNLVMATFDEALVSAYYPNDAVWNASLDLVAGRFDGSAQYQLAAAAMGRLYFIKSKSGNYQLGATKTDLGAAGSGGLQILNLAAGNFDGDDDDEIAVMNGLLTSTAANSAGTAYYYALDGSLSVVKGPSPVSCGSVTLSSGSVATGDVDGDRLDELVFTGNSGPNGIYAIVLDDALAASPYASLAYGQVSAASGYYSIGCVAFDYDDDGADEILGRTCLFDDMGNATGTSLKTLISEATFAAKLGAVTGGMYYDDCVATGQFNGSASGATADSFEDLAFLTADVGNLVVCSWKAKGGAMEVTNIDTYDGGYGNYPCLASANVDEDSTYIKHIGYELLYTDPHVVAFLACYPYWEGIDMSGGSSYSFGEIAAEGTERSVGFSAGVTVGYSDGIPNTVEASITTSITTGMDYNWGSEYEVSVSAEFISGREDKVVFTSIPYDVYYYEVLSSPEAIEGERIVVSVPRAPVISAAELGFYNANNGACQDITSDNLLTHSMGNPKSYPGPQFVLDRIDDGSMVIYRDDANIHQGGPNAVQVGQGDGATTIALSYGSSSSETVSWDIGIEVEAEVNVTGVIVGGSVGFHYGESYTVTSGTDTSFSGTIGDLSAADAAAGKAFPFSLFVYQKLLPNTADKVLVLEYCYEGK